MKDYLGDSKWWPVSHFVWDSISDPASGTVLSSVSKPARKYVYRFIQGPLMGPMSPSLWTFIANSVKKSVEDSVIKKSVWKSIRWRRYE